MHEYLMLEDTQINLIEKVLLSLFQVFSNTSTWCVKCIRYTFHGTVESNR